MCSATMCLKEPFKVGYALVLKKQRSFIQPSFVEYARSKGIELICIDLHRSLAEQGPFDAILHKLSGEEWNRQLLEYEQNHPGVMIIDPPEAIERLHNRISMLQAVSELQVTDERETFGIPKQSVVDRSEGLSDQKALSGLKFPIIAKPLVADGSAKSHHMSLIFNQESLAKLKPPLVLQEFVNHGGVIFKVYVVGDHVKCVRRRSLPDVDEDDITESEAPLAFSQISNISNRASAQQSGESFGSDFLHGGTASLSTEFLQAELPPSKFVQDLAKGLRRALGLRLFNFDLIRDTKIGNHYHVIDINYFPGYAKMPAYESVLTDFFLGLAKKKAAKEASDGIEPVSDSKATAAVVN